MSLQSVAFVSGVAIFGDATAMNVVDSIRGVWSVAAVWLIGHWFASTEAQLGAGVLRWRLAGAALMTSASESSSGRVQFTRDSGKKMSPPGATMLPLHPAHFGVFGPQPLALFSHDTSTDRWSEMRRHCWRSAPRPSWPSPRTTG